MSKKVLMITTAVGVLALGAGIAVWSLSCGDDAGDDVVARRTTAQVGEASAKKRTVSRVRVRGQKPGIPDVAEVRVRPDMTLEDGDEANLTAEMLAVYRALQDALDHDDKRRVFALVRELQMMDEWPDGIPISVKKRALSALAWFGSSGIAESVGFLEDSNPEVRNSAVAAFEQQLADSWDSGDKALSTILVALSKVVSDADALDTFYGQLDNMRPSVRAETVAEIYTSGNENAKQVLDKDLENIFGADDTEVKTREDVATAVQTAKAEEEADPEKVKEYDDLYGPTNWNW